MAPSISTQTGQKTYKKGKKVIKQILKNLVYLKKYRLKLYIFSIYTEKGQKTFKKAKNLIKQILKNLVYLKKYRLKLEYFLSNASM